MPGPLVDDASPVNSFLVYGFEAVCDGKEMTFPPGFTTPCSSRPASEKSYSMVAPCLIIPGGRASAADSATAVAASLVVRFEALATEYSARSGSVVALCCASSRGRASQPGFTTAVQVVLVVSYAPGQTHHQCDL